MVQQHLKKTIWIIVALCCSLQIIVAQSSSALLRAEIKALPDPETGEVKLRWAPVDFASWQWGIAHGYTIKRTPLIIDGVPATMGEMMQPTIVVNEYKPLESQHFQSFLDANPSNEWAFVGAGAIYGEDFTVLDPNIADITQVVNQNKEQQNRFSFGLFAAEQSFQVATAMGLAFTDNVIKNSTYNYTIELSGTTPANGHVSRIMVNTNEPPDFPQPRLSAEAGDKSVTLRWERDNLEQYYNSYDVEYITNTSVLFEKRNNRPVVFISANDAEEKAIYYRDSLANNNQPYAYQVRGITSFGTYGPASNLVGVVGKPAAVPGLDFSIVANEHESTKIKITWAIPTSMAQKISKLNVMRAPEVNKPYQKLNPAPLSTSITEYVDNSPLPANYYMVVYEDINGHEHRTAAVLGQVNDATPPSMLARPTCTCSAAGVVKVSWLPGTDDDILGYRVFMSNNEQASDMLQITPDWIKGTTYTHTITMNTLSEEVYFSVRAIDYRENTGPLSLPCKAIRPDVIPPSAPVIDNYTQITTGVRFKFTPSSSSDVVNYKFQRRKKSYIDWQTLAVIPPNALSQYTDSTAYRRHVYEYRLVAYDEAGLGGASKVLEVKPFDNGLRPPILNLQGTPIGAPITAVNLTWQYPQWNDPDLMGFQIQRAVGGDPIRNLLFVNVQQASTNDNHQNGINDFAWGDPDVSTFKRLITNSLTLPISVVPNLLGGNTGVVVRYVVYAKYIDGAMSPLANITVTW
jgi:uncharacterized protein